MRTVAIILVMGLSVLANAPRLQAQATVRGRVVDSDTGKPLEDVNVYLSGTKIGAATNAGGRYRLSRVPAGGYRLIISMLGYGTKIKTLIIGPQETLTINIELKPVVYELPELNVTHLDEEWKENLKRFTTQFIGKNKWADSVKILNPEVLRFDKNWWGRLTAEAYAPLKIENRALGYIIIYHLKEFSHSGGLTKWDGEPLFTEMIPADSAQATYWEQNRREAFYGSLRHFLLALLADRLGEEGFILYNRRQEIYGYSRNRDRSDGQRFIDESQKDFLYHLNFFGRLEIIYLNEEEEPAYVRWLPGVYRAPRGTQTSYLILSEHPVTVDSDGEIIQPYGATQFGYFSYGRLAVLTPRGYRPEDYVDARNN